MSYSMKELCIRVGGKREQTLYRLMRENKEFSEIVENNKTKTAGKVTYEEPVLSWLIAHYNSDSVEVIPDDNDDSVRIRALEKQIQILERERETLIAQVQEKDRQLARKDNQIRESNENEGAALLALQQEQHTIKMLTAPKASLWKRLFGGKNDNGNV